MKLFRGTELGALLLQSVVHGVRMRERSNVVVSLRLTSMKQATTNGEHVLEQLRVLHTDPLGRIHIADDGVLRSYSADGRVIDFVRFSNAHLQAIGERMSRLDAGAGQHLKEVYKYVDGNSVGDAAGFNPSSALRPLDFEETTEKVPFAEGHALAEDQARNDKRVTHCPDITCYSQFDCDLWNCGHCVQMDNFVRGRDPGMCLGGVVNLLDPLDAVPFSGIGP